MSSKSLVVLARISSAIVLTAVCALSTACGRREAPSQGVPAAAATDRKPTPNPPVPAQPAKPLSASSPRIPACSLISSAEVAAILSAPIGKSVAENSERKSSCAYPPGEAGSYAQAEITIEWEHPGGPTLERQMVDAFGGSAVGRQVAHAVELGDEASYSSEGVLSVRTGKTLVTITLPMRGDSEEKVTMIARKVLEQLGGTAASRPADAAAVPAKRNGDTAFLKELFDLFGNDSKPDAKQDAEAAPGSDTSRASSSIFPEGLEPGGACPDPGPSAAADLSAAASATIPLKEGLTLAYTWAYRGDDYDHECLTQVITIDNRSVLTTSSCPVGDDHHLQQSTRRLCRGDLRDSHLYVPAGHHKYPDTFRGALAFSLSSKSFASLTTKGEARHRFVDLANPREGRPLKIDADLDGILKRGANKKLPTIVNDRTIDLPVVEASGTFTDKDGHVDEFSLMVLDDERFPLTIDHHIRGFDKFFITYTKISFPTDGELEKHLAVEKRADVYGIYFDSGSDRLRMESEPVLREIADALTRNPSWKLSVNGHTDNIGGEAFNLGLSRRRSESVRRALTDRYRVDPARLTPAGSGASQPKASNATAEGRARNRRVELVRQ